MDSPAKKGTTNRAKQMLLLAEAQHVNDPDAPEQCCVDVSAGINKNRVVAE